MPVDGEGGYRQRRSVRSVRRTPERTAARAIHPARHVDTQAHAPISDGREAAVSECEGRAQCANAGDFSHGARHRGVLNGIRRSLRSVARWQRAGRGRVASRRQGCRVRTRAVHGGRAPREAAGRAHRQPARGWPNNNHPGSCRRALAPARGIRSPTRLCAPSMRAPDAGNDCRARCSRRQRARWSCGGLHHHATDTRALRPAR